MTVSVGCSIGGGSPSSPGKCGTDTPGAREIARICPADIRLRSRSQLLAGKAERSGQFLLRRAGGRAKRANVGADEQVLAAHATTHAGFRFLA
jgi:hypothetical protein